MILGLHHCAISTHDIDRLTRFYTELLGFEVVHKQSWDQDTPIPNRLLGTTGSAADLVMLRQANSYVELFQFHAPTPEDRSRPQRLFGRGLTHLCIAVKDLPAEYERLKAAGMEFHSEPLPRPTHNAVYGHDPDGNVVELLELYDSSHPFYAHWTLT